MRGRASRSETATFHRRHSTAKRRRAEVSADVVLRAVCFRRDCRCSLGVVCVDAGSGRLLIFSVALCLVFVASRRCSVARRAASVAASAADAPSALESSKSGVLEFASLGARARQPVQRHNVAQFATRAPPRQSGLKARTLMKEQATAQYDDGSDDSSRSRRASVTQHAAGGGAAAGGAGAAVNGGALGVAGNVNPPAAAASATASASAAGRRAPSSTSRRSAGVKKFVEPARDKNHRVVFPLKLGQLTVHAIGHIVYNRQSFHTSAQLFPAGFMSSREFPSMTNPNVRVRYTSEIVDDGGDAPVFVITPPAGHGVPMRSASASGAAKAVLIAVNKARGRVGTHNAISGPNFFGLTHPTVIQLMCELENVDKCRAFVPGLPTGRGIGRARRANEEAIAGIAAGGVGAAAAGGAGAASKRARGNRRADSRFENSL